MRTARFALRWCVPCLALALAWLTQVPPAQAEERISAYVVDAVLDRQGVLTVTERLTVIVEHDRIKRGITRTYPVKQRLPGFGLRHFSFDILSVTRDGAPSKYHQDERGYMSGVAVGSADVIIPPGPHVYEITYRSTGHVRSLPEHDELYYNAIGLDVAFPVDTARFRLTLPEGATVTRTRAFVGRAGSTEAGASGGAQGNVVEYATTRALQPGEAFTVVADWNKGVVAPGGFFDECSGATRNTLFGGLLAAVVVLLAVGHWWYRRPTGGTVIPLFHPPKGVTPAMAAWLRHRRFSALGLQAEILWAATQGWLRMDMRSPDTTILTGTDAAVQGVRSSQPWMGDASRKARNIIMRRDPLDLADTTVMTRAHERMREHYAPRMGACFDTGLWWGLAVLALGVAVFAGLLCFVYHPGLDDDDAWVFLAICLVCLVLCCLALYGIVKKLPLLRVRPLRTLAITAGYAMLFWAMGAVYLDYCADDNIFAATLAGLVALPLLFIWRNMAVLNARGRGMNQELRGLEMYINTAEKDRLTRINAPDDSVAVYEELLPYAVALGCVKAWQRRFDPLLLELDYAPAWADIPLAPHGMPRDRERPMAAVSNFLSTGSSASRALRSAFAASESTRLFSGGFSSVSLSDFSGGSSGFSGGSSGGGSGGGGVGGW